MCNLLNATPIRKPSNALKSGARDVWAHHLFFHTQHAINIISPCAVCTREVVIHCGAPQKKHRVSLHARRLLLEKLMGIKTLSACYACYSLVRQRDFWRFSKSRSVCLHVILFTTQTNNSVTAPAISQNSTYRVLHFDDFSTFRQLINIPKHQYIKIIILFRRATRLISFWTISCSFLLYINFPVQLAINVFMVMSNSNLRPQLYKSAAIGLRQRSKQERGDRPVTSYRFALFLSVPNHYFSESARSCSRKIDWN